MTTFGDPEDIAGLGIFLEHMLPAFVPGTTTPELNSTDRWLPHRSGPG